MQRPLHLRSIRLPGHRIQLPGDRQSVRNQEFNGTSLILNLVGEFANAALAQKYFEASQSRALWRNFGPSLDPTTRHDPADSPEIQFQKSGERHRLRQERKDEIDDYHSIFFAKGFVSSLDHFDRVHSAVRKTFPKIASDPGISARFPDLRGIRNTLHHMEDRLRDIGSPTGKPIPRVGGENPIIPYRGEGRVFLYGLLNDHTFFCTMGNGKVGTIDISQESLDFMFTTLGRTINEFGWFGEESYISLP